VGDKIMNPIKNFAKFLIQNAESISREIVNYNSLEPLGAFRIYYRWEI
jgi:hypothetical protein